MASLFTGSQIVELAIQIEKNGEAFYQAAKKVATSEDAKGVFDYLMSEERRHSATFQGLLKGLELTRPPESYEGEWDAYLKTAAAEHMFTDDARAKAVIAQVKSQGQAIEFAIGFEKDSIILFYELGELVQGKNKDIVEKLVNEEKEHLRRLSTLKKLLG